MSDQKNAPTLEVEYRLLGRTGKTAFACYFGNESLHQAAIDLSAARNGTKVKEFIDAVCQARPGEIERARVEQLMHERVTEAFNDLVLANDGDSGFTSKSQATELVELSDDAYLFCTPGADPEVYATLTEDENRKTWAVRSMGFRRWLINLFYRRHEKAPGSQALQDAVNTIMARAVSGGNAHDVHMRLARRSGAIWLDLADETGTAVEVTSAGWRIVPGARVPVPFIRRRGTLALPQPTAGSSICELRQFVNVAREEDWQLVVAWLIAALRPGYPFPVLDVTGEQGSAKTTTTRVLRQLIDPNKLRARILPRNPRDLFIAASNVWVFAIDNVSSLSPWQSDGLCVLATGGGFGTRQLYADDDEKLFDVMRPVILNSISAVVERSDLLDRSVSIVLPRIADTERVPEELFWARFEQCHGALLGALLDAISAALANLDAVALKTLPRMADFGRWVTAAEPALGWEPGSFLRSYLDNRSAAHVVAIETSAIGPALLLVLKMFPAGWGGTATELLDALERKADDRTKRREDWPGTPGGLSKQLRRLAPNLREHNFDIGFGRDGSGRRIVISTGSSGADATERGATASSSVSKITGGRDRGDGCDGPAPHSSHPAEEGFQAPHNTDGDPSAVRP